MLESKLFCVLPDYICTPDGMTIDKEGNLVLSCPNYAQDDLSGCVVKIDREGNVRKWFDVPVHPETGVARNMGIAFDADWNVYLCDNQGWSEREDLLFKGRVLKLTVDDAGNILKCVEVARNMEHPNGIRIRGNYMYVTQSYLHPVKREDGKLVSCVYRFGLDEENIEITNTLEDKHILATFVTHNPDCQYGADGIVFDKDGNLYVGNFGDGAVYKVTFNEDGSVKENTVFAQNAEELRSTDGMIFDERDNLYIADFSANAIVKVSPEGKVERIAQSPDCTGVDGGLDQPGEPIVWNGKLIASCFDLVTGPDKVNQKHEMPATLVYLDLQNTEPKIELASRALLSMQRHSWEQGTAMQAFLEMDKKEVVIAMAYEAAYRRLPDGRTAMLGDGRAVTDPCSVGEALQAACRWTEDAFLQESYQALLTWALEYAPRNEKGVLYHLAHLEEFWVDSLYMLPPFLVAAGYVEEALVNFHGYVEALYDKEAHLMGHRWDDGAKQWVRRDHWGTGNGWALAAMARMIPVLREKKPVNAEFMIALAIDLIEHLLPLMRQDGLFYDVVDDEKSFVETNLSQMLAYTIYRGVKDGWICEKALVERYLAAAEKMRKAANEKVNAYGFVADVCGAPTFDKPGFSPEGQAFYLLMEQAAKDLHETEIG